MDMNALIGGLYQAFGHRARPEQFTDAAACNTLEPLLSGARLQDIGLAQLGGGSFGYLNSLTYAAFGYCLPRLLELALQGLRSHDGHLFAEHLLRLLGATEEHERFERYSEPEVMAVLDAIDYLYVEMGEQMSAATLDDALMLWADKVV